MIISYTEKDVYTTYVIKDYGFYRRHIVSKVPFRKRNFEEYEPEYVNNFDDLVLTDDINFLDVDNFSKTDEFEIRRLSQLRAKNKIHAIAMLNPWHYMVTLTFDPKKYDSTDPNVVLKATLLWIRKQYKKYGIKYLLVPEYHADRKKIHWHGLIYDPNHKIKLELANIKSNKNHDIYNIVSWTNNKGWNTCAKIGGTYEDRARISNYVIKYITKDMTKIFSKYYYCSNGLLNEPKVSYSDVVPDVEGWFENDYCYIKDEIKDEFKK